MRLVDFLILITGEITFLTSGLLFCSTTPIEKGSTLKGPLFRRAAKMFKELSPLKVYLFPLNAHLT